MRHPCGNGPGQRSCCEARSLSGSSAVSNVGLSTSLCCGPHPRRRVAGSPDSMSLVSRIEAILSHCAGLCDPVECVGRDFPSLFHPQREHWLPKVQAVRLPPPWVSLAPLRGCWGCLCTGSSPFRATRLGGWAVFLACFPLSRKQHFIECLGSVCNAVGGWRRGSRCF